MKKKLRDANTARWL